VWVRVVGLVQKKKTHAVSLNLRVNKITIGEKVNASRTKKYSLVIIQVLINKVLRRYASQVSQLATSASPITDTDIINGNTGR
jgi:hypothetical protein